MKKKVFIDTNILLSGIFFSGNESKLLSLLEIDLITSDLVLEEAREVVRRKFQVFGVESFKVALEELENALMDFTEIIQKKDYIHKFKTARELIDKEKDSRILAAVLAVKPDYFVTGDTDFYTLKIKKILAVCKTREILAALKL